MTRRSFPALAICGVATLLVLSGCGNSPATRFYTLASLQRDQGPPMHEVGEPRAVIAVGPVELADYLDRPQIVRRNESTRIDLLEFDHWAGSLQSDLARVLVDDLAVLLAPAGYRVVPWEETALADGRIHVAVTGLEATDQEMVRLNSLWTLFGKGRGEILAAGNEVIIEPVGSGGAEGIVEAMSRTVAELSRRIAGEVASAPLRQAEGSPK
jgi:uncharacterized protein